MSIEHSTILDPEIHEPKDIALATSAQVYTASGAGTGTWADQHAPASHASSNITANTNTIAITAAVDNTMHTATDYVPITGLTAKLLVGSDISHTGGDFLINTTGWYQIGFWLSMSSSSASSKLAMTIGINGVVQVVDSAVLIQLMKTAGDIGNVSGIGTIPLSAGDIVTGHIASDTTSNITIHEAVSSLTRIR
ncbi:MAG: hypothetical protein QQN63_01605 [Nitrosopumilus sp.]